MACCAAPSPNQSLISFNTSFLSKRNERVDEIRLIGAFLGGPARVALAAPFNQKLLLFDFIAQPNQITFIILI